MRTWSASTIKPTNAEKLSHKVGNMGRDKSNIKQPVFQTMLCVKTMAYPWAKSVLAFFFLKGRRLLYYCPGAQPLHWNLSGVCSLGYFGFTQRLSCCTAVVNQPVAENCLATTGSPPLILSLFLSCTRIGCVNRHRNVTKLANQPSLVPFSSLRRLF